MNDNTWKAADFFVHYNANITMTDKEEMKQYFKKTVKAETFLSYSALHVAQDTDKYF